MRFPTLSKTSKYVLGGATVLALIIHQRKRIKKGVMDLFGFTKIMKYPIFMNTALGGESKGYNDFNYKSGKGYGSYLHNIRGTSTIKKLLTQMTIGEVIQAMNEGKLYATGRYQIIPITLQSTYPMAKLSVNDMYNEENQDKLGNVLVDSKKRLRDYLTHKVADNETNLNNAIIDSAQVWSSIGVPYTLTNYKGVTRLKNQSYYPYDKASTPSEKIGEAIKAQRKAFKKS